MKVTEQTRLTLTGVHYAAFSSEETSCFEATLRFDGQPVCVVSNDGRGGADRHLPLRSQDYAAMRAALLPVEAFIATLEGWTYDAGPIPGCGATTELPMPHTLETAVAELLNRVLVEREFDRRAKANILYTRSDRPGVFIVKESPAKVEAWRAWFSQKNPAVAATVLNVLPRPQALALYQSEGAK